LDADLDGKGQKVVIDHDPSLELDEGSLVLDFTADDVLGTQSLLSKDSEGYDDGGHLSIWLQGDQVVARLQSADASYSLSSDPGAIEAGKAHQVAVSFGDDGFRLYVDGVQVDQSDYTGGIEQNEMPLVIGAGAQRSSDGGADNLQDFFNGTIAQLTIHDQPFSVSQPEPDPVSEPDRCCR
jgi:hypothetical protein